MNLHNFEEKFKLKIDSRIIELINLILKNNPIDSQIYLDQHPFSYIPKSNHKIIL